MTYEIITDSAANLTDDLLEKYNIRAISYICTIDGKEYICYEKGRDYDTAARAFYEKMRGTAEVKTTLINATRMMAVFEPIFESGRDILFIGMSSGLTGTYQSALIAKKEMEEQYPERKCVVVDSIAASLGEGLQVIDAAELRAEGKSLEETAEQIKNTRLGISSIFTVDDLMYLRRGGRVSSATAIIGTLLHIKPILRATDEGTIELVTKVRGRRKALDFLVSEFESKVVFPENQTIAITHCDCEADANYVAEQLRARYAIKDILIRYYDICSGAHVGPGALALFFRASGR